MPKMEIIIRVPRVDEVWKAFRDMGNLLEKELDFYEKQFDKTYSTWSAESRPDWERVRSPSVTADHLWWRLETQSTPYVWVVEGTRWGRVTFSRDYRPMTRPRVIGSRARRGRVVRRGRGANFFWGIQPREFHYELVRRHKDRTIKNVQRELDKFPKRFIRYRKARKYSVSWNV